LALAIRIHPEAARFLGCEPDAIPDFLRTAIERRLRLLSAGSDAVLKDSPESAVALVDVPGFPRVCVKELRWRGWLHSFKGLFRATQGVRSFRNGRKLREAGFGVASPLALITDLRSGLVRSEWVIMEVIPGAIELDRYIVKRTADMWPPEEKIALARLFGRFIGSMHGAGIFHSDLKTCNVLVSEEAVHSSDPPDTGRQPSNKAASPRKALRFSLLDYDNVRFSRQVSWRRKIKNLVQIFLSTPVAIKATQRLLFLNEYALHVGLNPHEKRVTARTVIEEARGKDILYVGLDGDVREEWRP
jgi:tRNA A-37 threonylcarbamoyl transferase component Bud32